jgi:acetylglutamate synthase
MRWHVIRISSPMLTNKGEYMTKAQLLKKIAYLESVNDQLSTEVTYVDHLMRLIGFSEGLITVKATAQEILDKEIVNLNEYEAGEESA